MWRDQERDLCLLHSFLDDMKQYYQWKASKWEKIAYEIRYARQLKGYLPDEEEESEETVLRRALMGDDDYRDLVSRLATELDEAKAILHFLEYEPSQEMESLDLKAALIPNPILEATIDDIEWLIPVCKAFSYPWTHFRTAMKHPRQWLRDFYEG